jgi:AraC-like DNA-binding protein
MAMAEADFAPVRFSTADLPARERIPIAREVFGRQMMGIDIEPLGDRPLQLDMTIRRLPALRVGTMSSPGVRLMRSPELIADDEDVFSFAMELGQTSNASSRDRDVTLGAGDAVLMHSMAPCVTTHRGSRFVAAVIPRTALAPLVANVDDRVMRSIPADNEALRLLPVYLRTVCGDMPMTSSGLALAVENHVLDLVALAVGATRDGTAQAKSRGLAAARLAVIKTDILANLGRRDLSIDLIADRHGLSARHIRRLLSAEDTSFSDFVLEQRLMRAYRMLSNPRHAKRSISAVAYECGFGDLSYFNRCFRRRFGASPREFRH